MSLAEFFTVGILLVLTVVTHFIWSRNLSVFLQFWGQMCQICYNYVT